MTSEIEDINIKRRVLGKPPVFLFDQLDENIKQRVLEKWSTNDGYLDYEWWESTYDDFVRVCDILGVDVELKSIEFDTYPWYARFNGTYKYAKGCARAIRKYAPKDTMLHNIADGIVEAQRPNRYGLSATISKSGRQSVSIDVQYDGNYVYEQSSSQHDLENNLKSLASWLANELESTYNWHYEDEQVEEDLLSCYTYFLEDGDPIFDEDL